MTNLVVSKRYINDNRLRWFGYLKHGMLRYRFVDNIVRDSGYLECDWRHVGEENYNTLINDTEP